MSYLENSNVKLRALEPSDVELLYLWENDTNLWHVSDTLSPFSRDILQRYIELAHKDIYEQKQLRLAVDIKDADMYHTVGLVDLFDIDFLNHRAGVGVMVYATKDRKKGYAAHALRLLATYCFERLGLHQLYCHILSDNTASIRLFSSLGFEHAGTLKEWHKTPSGWQDVRLMQLVDKKQLTN